MSSTKYTYAVARIRALETALFDASVIEQLLACSTEQQCIQLLQEKGWGDADTPAKAEAILDREQERRGRLFGICMWICLCLTFFPIPICFTT